MASKKKRAEKKKDFVKTKLRVGKGKTPGSNQTDTLFVARTLLVPTQLLAAADSLPHQLLLLGHHSAQTRREVLAHMALHLPTSPAGRTELVAKAMPLALDSAPAVRTALVECLTALQELAPTLVEVSTAKMVLFIHSAMLHIQPGVKNDAPKLLRVLLASPASALAVCSQHWNRTLQLYCQLMGWPLTASNARVAITIGAATIASELLKRARALHLQVLRQFMARGLERSTGAAAARGPHPATALYMIPTRLQPYAMLRLYGSHSDSGSGLGTLTVDDLPSVALDDVETRHKVVRDVFLQTMLRGTEALAKEGGDTAVAARALSELLASV